MECCGLKIRTRFLRSLILILIAEATGCWLFFSVYLSSLPVAHLSDAPEEVVTVDSTKIQDETTESSA